MSLSHESDRTDEQLVRYLLGQLPDEDAQRVEELSIVDDEVAQRIGVVENDLVDAYVSGKLVEPNRTQFERVYLATARRREKVRFAESLLGSGTIGRIATPEDVNAARNRLRGPTAAPQKARARGGRWFEWFLGSPETSWGLAVAAALLLIVTGVLAFQAVRLRNELTGVQSARAALDQRTEDLERQLAAQQSANADATKELSRVQGMLAEATRPATATQPPTAPAPGVFATLLLAPQTRAAGPLPTLSLRPGAEGIALELLVDPAAAPGAGKRYRAVLKSSESAAVVWHADLFAVADRDQVSTVSVNIPARGLKAQTYLLELFAAGASAATEPVGTYAFRIMMR